ncbi:MAG: hypothetical protein KDD25_08435 [Bdellovibrionales bacterium]|nr:hypothetical protein [Bdellovibrionales bacterium]
MKSTVLVVMVLMSIGQTAKAGFDCSNASGGPEVVTEHLEEISFSFKDDPARIKIVTEENQEIQMTGFVTHLSTRVGSHYNYKLPVDGLQFYVNESVKVVHNPGCKPGGRVTCDFDWITTFTGKLSLNGISYELDCKPN